MSECVVYWLFDALCTDVRKHGYVGISEKWEKRLIQHRGNRSFPKDFDYAILYTGTLKQCYAMEAVLRPDHGIGWNKSKGGPNQGRTFGYKHSVESRANVSAALKGRKITWADKLSEAGKGFIRSEESRAKQSASMTGIKKTKKHRMAISKATKLRYRRPGESEKTSKAVKAGLPKDHSKGERNPRFGVVMSEETKRKISQSQRRRLAQL